MEATTQARPTADVLNAHLSNGGLVQVTTYTRSTLYYSSHAGYFAERDGSLYVRRGRSWDRLSHGESLLVGIQTARLK